jgi:phage gpG-like protein
MAYVFFKNILNDIKVELSEEFDRNFERKAFFDRPWPATKIHNKRGSLMLRSGYLRRSLHATLSSNEIRFTSSAIFAEIQNNGGKIHVTAKMKRFFWAMYYKTSKKGKTGGRVLTAEASMWKGMALKPVGSVITIPARTFMGNHPQVDLAIKRVFDADLQELENYLNTIFKRH